MYALTIFTPTGADSSAARPPPFTTTPTAIFGLSTGAKQVKTASSRPVLFTPFCAVPVFAAIANKGTLMRPYLVQRVIAPNLTNLVTAQPSVLSQTVSPAVAGQVTQMMASVVANPAGTAHQSAYIPGLPAHSRSCTRPELSSSLDS